MVFALLTYFALTQAQSDSVAMTVLPPGGKPNAFAVGNKAPLSENLLSKLPIGAIEPHGWLRKQIRLQADGFAGHLTEISRFLNKQDNAWLSPAGEGKNGWEEVPYWLRGFGDLGYVLHDKRILDETRIWIEATLKSQRQDGYFGPRSNLKASNGKPDIWPNMLMLNALQSYHEATGDLRVLKLMTNYFRWELAMPEGDMLTGYWEHVRSGDNLASVFWLYNRTGDKWLLDLAVKLHRRGAPWVKDIINWHGVNFAQGFREPAEYSQLSKKHSDAAATDRNFMEMRNRYGQSPGGMYAADENARPGFTDPRQATETCSMVEMMHSSEMLMAITGRVEWADECEDVAFNELPASMTEDLKALHYLTAPNMVQADKKNKSPELENGGPMLLFDPNDHRCCQHNTAMGWPYFAEHLWMATNGNGLAAVLYAPCRVKAKVADGTAATIDETTDYPFSDTIKLRIGLSGPTTFPIALRVPGWCRAPKVTVNGMEFRLNAADGGFAVVTRDWKDGDQVMLSLPMSISLRRWNSPEKSIAPFGGGGVSIYRGPLAYSLKMGMNVVKAGGTAAWPAFEIYPTTPWNYGLIPSAALMKVHTRRMSDQPFALGSAPIVITAMARRIPEWQQDYLGLVGKLQNSPAKTDQPVETIELVPMGAARLRISVFPTVGFDGNGMRWIPPQRIDLIPAKSSARGWFDSTDALSDTFFPRSPNDSSPPRFTWAEKRGTSEWVEYDFPKPRTVSTAEVYWIDETSSFGSLRVPASWKVLYRSGDAWKEVEGAHYTTLTGAFSTATFNPVTAGEFRVVAQLQPKRTGGIWEWRLK